MFQLLAARNRQNLNPLWMEFLKILHTVKIVDKTAGKTAKRTWLGAYQNANLALSSKSVFYREVIMNELKRNEWLPQCSHATTSYSVRFIVAFKLLLGDCLVTIFAEPPNLRPSV